MFHNLSNAPDAQEVVYLDDMSEDEIQTAILDIASYADDHGWTADARYFMDRLKDALEVVRSIPA